MKFVAAAVLVGVAIVVVMRRRNTRVFLQFLRGDLILILQRVRAAVSSLSSLPDDLRTSLGALFTPRWAHTRVASADDMVEGHVPLLVRVLAGNPVTVTLSHPSPSLPASTPPTHGTCGGCTRLWQAP